MNPKKTACVFIAALCAWAACVPKAAGEASVETLIEQLGDKEYKLRRAAYAKLFSLGPGPEAALERAAKSDDPEVALSAAALLENIRLGITPDWPEDLAKQVREYQSLDTAQRFALFKLLPEKLSERAVPFLLSRRVMDNASDARYVHQCLKTADSTAIAEAVAGLGRQPLNAMEANVLAWAYLKLKRPKDALQALSAARDADPDGLRQIAEPAVECMIGMLNAGQCDELVKMSEGFAQTSPDDARFLYLRAAAFAAQEGKGKADELYARALELNPQHKTSHVAAGEMLLKLKLYGPAVRELEKSLEIPPNENIYDINARLRLGEAYEHLQQYDRAADSLARALALIKKFKGNRRGGFRMPGVNESDVQRRLAALRKKPADGGKNQPGSSKPSSPQGGL